MGKFARAVFTVAVMAACVSCAGTVYSRAWVINSQNLTDKLTISGDSFRLERTGQSGTSTFEGAFEDKGDQWVFDVTRWTPANATAQNFDPPVRYIYQVKKFENGVSFLSLSDVVGTSTFQFIQRGDFQRQ